MRKQPPEDLLHFKANLSIPPLLSQKLLSQIWGTLQKEKFKFLAVQTYFQGPVLGILNYGRIWKYYGENI